MTTTNYRPAMRGAVCERCGDAFIAPAWWAFSTFLCRPCHIGHIDGLPPGAQIWDPTGTIRKRAIPDMSRRIP